MTFLPTPDDALAAMPAMMAFFDEGQVCRFVSPHDDDRYLRLSGEPVGRHLRDLLGEAVYAARRPLLERVATGEAVAFEARVPHHDGSVRDVALHYLPRLDGARFVGFWAFLYDFARHGHRFRSLFDGTTTGFLIVDLAGMNALFASVATDDLAQRLDDLAFVRAGLDAVRIVDANPKACAMLGASREAILARPLGHWYPDAELATTAQNMRDMLAGVTAFQVRARLRRGDGEPLDVLLGTTFADDPRDASTIAIAMTDMTGEVRRERALADAQARLAHAARIATLGELTSSIAHEVNQPLAAVSGDAEAALRWLDRDVPDLAEAIAALRRIGAEAGRASRVITRVRALAVREAPVRAAVGVAGLVTSSAEVARRQVAALGAELRLNLGRGEVAVLGDEVQLQQVVINLVVNAAQAMHAAGSPRRVVTVDVGIHGPNAVIRVADTGPGVPDDRAQVIFDAFETDRVDGMGLGLSIARSIAVDHGGTLVVDPGDGEGGSFVLRLPSLEHPRRSEGTGV